MGGRASRTFVWVVICFWVVPDRLAWAGRKTLLLFVCLLYFYSL